MGDSKESSSSSEIITKRRRTKRTPESRAVTKKKKKGGDEKRARSVRKRKKKTDGESSADSDIDLSEHDSGDDFEQDDVEDEEESFVGSEDEYEPDSIKLRKKKKNKKKGGSKPAARAGSKRKRVSTKDGDFEELGSGEGDDDDDEEEEEGEYGRDFSKLQLKSDHEVRPFWVCSDGHIFLETFSPLYNKAYDFLIAISEPVCRPELIHEYALSQYSLYAAVSVGLETSHIVSTLNRMSKNEIPKAVVANIKDATESYGKVKLVLQQNRYFLESTQAEVLQTLLQDSTIAKARVHHDDNAITTAKAPENITLPGTSNPSAEQTAEQARLEAAQGQAGAAPPASQVESTVEEGIDAEAEEAWAAAHGGEPSGTGASAEKQGVSERPKNPDELQVGDLVDIDLGEDDERREAERNIHSFEIKTDAVELVRSHCIRIEYPTLEEYDFRNDSLNPDLPIDLKATTSIRSYQEKSLSKMFGKGRARSGVIVLPCGAGKTLVGITATATIKKSTLVLCTSSVAVEQWRAQFLLWSTLPEKRISRFTSTHREVENIKLEEAGVTISTYTMIAYSGKRSESAQAVMNLLSEREWGLIVMDEVHVVPAKMFRKVISVTQSHCKLGLTATLVREDERIDDLNFLIGPKLYEANWLDLQRAGHIAHVQCFEVWCSMSPEFYREYLGSEQARRRMLYALNPNKFRTTQYLINYHEARGDKILVFSDNIFALRLYAVKLRKPFIYGKTSTDERVDVLNKFHHSPKHNTLFISKVGDNSIDLPAATVLIQISSHYGSRRQEAQRLGRILRPKARGNDGSVNAYFYSLVSRDTQEMYYSSKRQQFLVNQGYSFKVLADLVAPDEHPELLFTKLEDQLELLRQVLATGEEEVDETMPEDLDDITRRKVKAVRRVVKGGMSALSGGHDRVYMEYSTKTGDAPSSGQPSAAAAPVPRGHHRLLKNRFKKR